MFKDITVFSFGIADGKDIAITRNYESGGFAGVFTPCSQSQDRAIGFTPPRVEHGDLIEQISGHRIMEVTIETKAVPKQAVDAEFDKRAKRIEEQEGRKPGRKESREMREDIIQALLPNAFPKIRAVKVWFDSQAERLVIGSAAQSVVDDVVTHLVRHINGLQISQLNTTVAPQAAMTQWLSGSDDEWPAGFFPGREVELKSGDEMNSVVKFMRHHLDHEEMIKHIKQGKLPTKVEICFDGRVNFVLTHALQIKKIAILDGVFDEAANDEGGFDADMLIITAELSTMIDALVQSLGGVME